MNMYRIVGAAVAGVALWAAAGCAGSAEGSSAQNLSAAAADGGTSSRTITATGTGIVSGTPDMVSLNLGVQSQADTAGAALTQNTKAANLLISTLKEQGIAEADMQTSQISVYPTYDNMGEKITGYEVSNFVVATLRDIDKAGSVIDEAQKAVGDNLRLNDIWFGFDDDSTLRSSARAAAVKQALKQAEELAGAAGVKAGDIVAISEGSMSSDFPVPTAAYAADEAAGAPLLPGTQDLAVTVSVVVAIG